MMNNPELEVLLTRIKELEDKLAQLRVSRRVLLSLLEKVEHEKQQQIRKLEKENRLLQLKNARLARIALNNHGQLTLVEGHEKVKS
ncbi:MAG: translation initiation factor 2 [Clostridia bacterium]|jgi:hypothetical protein|nr:translation initiation factor 2 [Clostridia bacterium]